MSDRDGISPEEHHDGQAAPPPRGEADQPEVARWLGGLKRRPAPDIAVATILERGRRARRRLAATACVALAACLSLFALLPGLWAGAARETPAPVHLELRVVDVESATGVETSGRDALEAAPEELRVP